MNPLTQLVFTAGLAALLGLLVLALPLIFMFAGQLRPVLLSMAEQRAADSGLITVRSAPLARRTAAARPTRSRKVALSRRPAAKPSTRKTPQKKRAAPKAAGPKSTAAAKGGKAAAKPKAKVPSRAKKADKKPAATNGATKDPKLGVIYKKKPSQVDDLKKISGVGKVLEAKLHAAGVYTYRQIADWTPAQMQAFGEQLSFKNRIERDDWKGQAAALGKARSSGKS